MKQEIIQGDCLEVMKGFADKSFDLVLTSPPYDNLRAYEGYSFNFEETAKEIFRVLKDGGVCVWVIGDATVKGSETGTSFRQALYFKEIGFNLHDTMIYQKRFYLPLSHKRYEQEFEYMFVFSRGTPSTFNALKVRSLYGGKQNTTTHRKDGITLSRATGYGKARNMERVIGNVWSFNPERGSEHPAPFPIQMAKDHILSWSDEGDRILDPFAGSGTTLIASKELARNAVGIEISPEYCEIARKRLEQDSLF